MGDKVSLCVCVRYVCVRLCVCTCVRVHGVVCVWYMCLGGRGLSLIHTCVVSHLTVLYSQAAGCSLPKGYWT